MKLELQSAANFLIHLIRLGRRNINENQLEKFRLALVEVLRRRYRDHWFPEKPFKGSGYRCIRINGKMDPVIVQAGESCGLSPQLIHSTFPSELTMWIDPREVSYRIGENGSICVLYEFKNNDNEPWRPSVTISSAPVARPVVNNNQRQGSSSVASSQGQRSSSSESSSPASSPTPTPTAALTCSKDSLRNKMEFFLGADPRKSVSIEQLAAFVTTS